MRTARQLIYSEMICIFPLVYATMKRNLESRPTKTCGGNYLSWREKSNNNLIKGLEY